MLKFENKLKKGLFIIKRAVYLYQLKTQTLNIMTNTIKNIVSEAIFQARCESSSVDRTMNLIDVKTEITIIVDAITFDTVVAKNMFMGFIETELQKTAPYLYPVKMGMDKFGNYTSNQKNWA